MPSREIQLGNTVEDSRLYDSFQRRHPRFPLIRRKTIGIGLIDLSLFTNGKDYISSVNGKNSAAYFSRKSQRAGFQFKLINPNNFIDSIQKIHLFHYVNSIFHINFRKTFINYLKIITYLSIF